MKKLSKEQLQEKTELSEKMRKALDALNEKIESANDKIRQINSDIGELYNTYQEACTEAQEFAQMIYKDMDEYYSNKSEKWQESEAGGNYDEWRNQWETYAPADNLDSFEEIEELQELDDDPITELDELGTKVSE